jgi:hypothetical protein
MASLLLLLLLTLAEQQHPPAVPAVPSQAVTAAQTFWNHRRCRIASQRHLHLSLSPCDGYAGAQLLEQSQMAHVCCLLLLRDRHRMADRVCRPQQTAKIY